MIVQQILGTPNLSFKLSHALLTATTTKAPQGDEEAATTIKQSRASAGSKLTQGQEHELLKSIIGLSFDKNDMKNEEVLNWWMARGSVGSCVVLFFLFWRELIVSLGRTKLSVRRFDSLIHFTL
jgi:hypothetical protein